MSSTNRRNFIATAGVVIAAALSPITAGAQSGEPITFVMPYGAGGAVDGLVRQIADSMTQELGQPVIIENKPGANGIIGATYAAAARPNGLTYFVGATGPLSLNVLLRENLTYDMDSFEPVGTMMSGPLTVTVPEAMGVNNIDELKAHAEETGNPLRYATLGPGSVTHLFGMVLQDALGVPMVPVSYPDNPSMNVDLIAGQIDLVFSTPISLVEHQEAGDLKMLAISTEERHPRFPDLPTTTELGYPQLVSSFWFGLLAPAGTPEEEIQRVSAALQNAVGNEELQQQMSNMGMRAEAGGPEAMQEQLKWDQEFWGGVIAENNLVLE